MTAAGMFPSALKAEITRPVVFFLDTPWCLRLHPSLLTKSTPRKIWDGALHNLFSEALANDRVKGPNPFHRRRRRHLRSWRLIMLGICSSRRFRRKTGKEPLQNTLRNQAALVRLSQARTTSNRAFPECSTHLSGAGNCLPKQVTQLCKASSCLVLSSFSCLPSSEKLPPLRNPFCPLASFKAKAYL